jgi:NADH:ubiquinone oxidoreductase subunit D
MGVYLVSDGTSKPYRVHIKAPGFIHLVNILFFSSSVSMLTLSLNRLHSIVLRVVICLLI